MACRRRGRRLVHFPRITSSTATVTAPTSSPTCRGPASVYAISKLARRACRARVRPGRAHRPGRPDSTALPHRSKGGNFVERIVERAREHGEVGIVADQRLTPTSTVDLARDRRRGDRRSRDGPASTNAGSCSCTSSRALPSGSQTWMSPSSHHDSGSAGRRDPATQRRARHSPRAGAGLAPLPPWQERAHRVHGRSRVGGVAGGCAGLRQRCRISKAQPHPRHRAAAASSARISSAGCSARTRLRRSSTSTCSPTPGASRTSPTPPPTRATRSSTATSRDADAWRRPPRAATPSSTSPPRRHVDRSIIGRRRVRRRRTCSARERLLDHVAAHAARRRFVQVSTDEVYGDVDAGTASTETTRSPADSPYAASKAAADLLVLAYVRTYGLDASIVRGANDVRAVPVPGEADPAVHDQRCSAASRCRCTATACRCASSRTSATSRRRSTTRAATRRGRRRLQRERRAGAGATPRPRARIAGARRARDAGLITHVADRPGHDRRYAIERRAACAPRLAARTVRFDDGPRRHRRVVREQRRLVAADPRRPRLRALRRGELR